MECRGLDPSTVDGSSPEALATLRRRTSAFLCPCTSTRLLTTTFALLEPLCADVPKEAVGDVLDALISYGDLVETADISGESLKQLVYTVPPSYVEVSPSTCLLIGIGPDGQYPMPESLKLFVEYTGHYRRIQASESVNPANRLSEGGLIQIAPDTWMKAPKSGTSESWVWQYDRLLQQSGYAGAIEDLTILDLTQPVTYYRGRWKKVKNETGRFVARRPQVYGADSWCYVHIDRGRVTQLLNLPSQESIWRPCDEAWHLQQAIDHQAGHPQLYRVRPTSSMKNAVVDFYSPLPGWARRRWDYVGTPALASGCLISYVFDKERVAKELEFAQERMWLRER